MAGSTISNHVTISVTLGSGSYTSPLTIAPSGFVDPFAGGGYGATALTATISGGLVLNQGTVAAGRGFGDLLNPGSTNFAGGIGIDLASGGLSNSGVIAGGGGGYSVVDPAVGGTGASGVVAADSSLTNTGTISGGNGGGSVFDYTGGVAGSGADVTNSSLINAGSIVGGTGGHGNFSNSGGGNGGAGGDGVDAATSTLTNNGVLAGGGGGFSYQSIGGTAGAGASVTVRSTLTNYSTLLGGTGGSGGSASGGGAGGAGATLAGGSTLTNYSTIQGGAGGYGGQGASAGSGGDGADIAASSLTNAGKIAGGNGGNSVHLGAAGNGGSGVSLQDGGLLINHGLITGGGAGSEYGIGGLFFAYGGVGVNATNSSVASDGTITGSTGVNLVGSTLTNDGLIQAGVVAANSTLTNNGTITGSYNKYAGAGAGAEITSGMLTNTGVIAGGAGAYGGAGVDVTSSVITNTGSITGGSGSTPGLGHDGAGVLFHGGGTLTSAGFIGGGVGVAGIADAVDFGAGPARLIDDPGAVFSGTVVAQGAFTTLELASAASIGTISGVGTSFTGFGTITVDAAATWVVTGSVTSSGTIGVGAGSDLTFDGGVAATSPVHFTANTGTLGLVDPADFAATVFGFQMGDAIDFTSITSAGSITAGVNGSNELTLTSSGVLLTKIQLDPGQSFAGDVFKAAPDGGGTLVTIEPLCFLAGTQIATLSGETPIERLSVGDVVVTARGDLRPIAWIGIGRVMATRGRRNAATPVIVRKGALGPNVPYHDLRVTKAHSLYFDGVLIPVEFLVNHRSILWDDRAQEVSIYHIELETHDVLLANGAPAESYRDDGNRWLFGNANSGWHLPAKQPCAPVLTGGDGVDAVWSRLLRLAGPRPGLPLTDDPDLHLMVGGRRVDAASRSGGFYVFRLAERPEGARVVCRSGAPQELGLARDPRDLGVALLRIVIRQGRRSRVIKAGDGLLVEGFHAFEADNGFRWTDGDADLPAPLFAGFEGPLEVVLHCAATARYVEDGAGRRMA
jgi:hypothetical protein